MVHVLVLYPFDYRTHMFVFRTNSKALSQKNGLTAGLSL